MSCKYSIDNEGGKKAVTIDCMDCEHSSSLLDENCRKNIFDIIIKENADKIVLNHTFVKVFDGSSMELLKKLATFIDIISSLDARAMKKCGVDEDIINLARKDPIEAYKIFMKNKKGKGKKKPVILDDECNLLMSKILKIGLEIDDKESNFYYMHEMQPYVRPIFFDTYIHFSPPGDAVFIKKYEVGKGRKMQVSLYSLSSRPEKMYFVIPPEYNLPVEEIKLLQEVKERLAKHRPEDASFMDPESSREYFKRFAKNEIKKMAKDLQLGVERLEMLSDIFAKYTAGLGLLEDLLYDDNIQDIYINAPVSNNPLHIVWNGEEYTTNIYFSENDVEALSSRFRSLSGRPFSEASPILDLGLEKYKARVAAISAPLTPKGIAFAIRRHSMTPWTLPKLVSLNMLTPLAAGLLSFLVDGQATILIAGSRGAGKTSLLSSLILEIPQRFRILTIEDTPELPVDELQSLGYKIQSLITQSITGDGGVDPKTALRTALRLGESVLILGEVRGEETKVLFEAMRVGAAGNVVLGTIHGATTRDVFERIVYDIGVTPASFKATDVVIIAAPMRIGGGMEKRRRVIQISEVVKTANVMEADKMFQDVMLYNAERDRLESTDLLEMGQSQIIGRIAKEWGISIENALANIRLRAKIKERIVEEGNKNPELLEAKAVRDANNAFWMLIEESKDKRKIDYGKIEKKWMKWYAEYIK
ncbi:MAG: type II/IV secretion system ATPase subunit [Thermoplasmata archaeon]|nr:type II/IV secretion system ATPase subunit [Thermoplasmata archaeon]